MNIAIVGATSVIAQDLLKEWILADKEAYIHLYARNIKKLDVVVAASEISRCTLLAKKISDFPDGNDYDVIINFIGVGDPSKAKNMSDRIMDITGYYDDLILDYLDNNQQCKYIFLSSGAAYGSDFSEPASIDKKAMFSVNNLKEVDSYGLAKFTAEIKHRYKPHLSIVDVRVFNYFSKNQDLESRFFITDILRSIINSEICDVNPEPMVRDYLHPKDFCQIVDCILNTEHFNTAVDCYSLAPIDKHTLLAAMQDIYGMKWRFTSDVSIIRATGTKSNYYSENKLLASLGYKPQFSSMDAILSAFDWILSKK